MTGKITLKPNEYQPRKAELEADVSLSLNVPGETLDDQADALAAAVMRTVEIEHEAAD